MHARLAPPAPRPPRRFAFELRERALRLLRRRVSRGAPRLVASALVSLTALAGFGASLLLRRLGVAHMGPRWAASVVIAYLAFLSLLALWAWWAGRRTRALPIPDLDDLGDLLPGGGRGGASWSGGGGRFSGAGASGTLELAGAPAPADLPALASGGGGGSGGGGFSLDLDLDVDAEWVVVIVAAVIALSVLLAAGWVIYSAPALLSEVLLDTGIAGGLWRSVFRRRGTGSGWLSALRHTWGIGLVVLLVFAIGGHVLDRVVPGAETLGQALHLVIHRGDASAEEPR